MKGLLVVDVALLCYTVVSGGGSTVLARSENGGGFGPVDGKENLWSRSRAVTLPGNT